MSVMDHSSFISPEFIIRAATARWEVEGAARLRRQVFVEEQRVFENDDVDEIDGTAIPLVAIATLAAEPADVVGTVRINEDAPGVWKGSRLAVAQSHRKVGRLGAELIRLAVSTANGRGCREFHAHVQIQNVPLFKRLHWVPVQETNIHGVPHMHMLASLEHYPPVFDPASGWTARGRRGT
ncbi:MSMEG_0567/Sll0786 family nitrogen starvation N-acetyltransferase [Rhizobium rhizogenes]|uniref:MSMEG_0567/Sll0786 family nitrogen starvation N-acetyltransferase n=1 Tax=Rhizobium rhizogenes TaxID=359 RepID=UPI001573D046|nr:MSMEG_0567/Sll0786 family nitrogen starvation N-acetyltransferase [Rhizobium rhizogenes]NTI78437.1 GNAT family N-acetyltransferase [Rhizobium rhizogenes]